MKTLSCSILILSDDHEILIGHVTGQRHFDLPKGTIEDGETHIQCAIREAKEEFGIDVPENELIPLGVYNYNSVKDLSIFLWKVSKSRIDISKCVCTTTFTINGQDVLEIDSFKWIRLDQIESHMAKSMCRVLSLYFGL